jgi:hypothetical protein
MRGCGDAGTRGRGVIATGMTVLRPACRVSIEPNGLAGVRKKVELFSASQIKLLPPTASPDFRVNQRVKLLEPCMT